jgi:hypothetical protein
MLRMISDFRDEEWLVMFRLMTDKICVEMFQTHFKPQERIFENACCNETEMFSK